MARKLVANVHGLRNPDTGQVHSFGPGDTLPTWATDMVDNPAAFEGDDADPGSVGDSASDVPAKSASKADWVAYAVAQGMTEEDAEAQTKDDLVAALSS